jgi:uncharacterized protein (DUF433 family)
MDTDLTKHRNAMEMIVEEPDIQGGAATFQGTRILVHQIIDLMVKGATEAELLEDYPRLTREMIAAAKIYANLHPRKGRARKPAWRKTRPLSVQSKERRGA